MGSSSSIGTTLLKVGTSSADKAVLDVSNLSGGALVLSSSQTLSGGGKEVISVGQGCLIGANAGIGISLGDGCVVEAGLYVTGGTVVSLPDGTTTKARELSGRPGLLFRRNSQTGAVEVLPREGEWGALNSDLHKN